MPAQSFCLYVTVKEHMSKNFSQTAAYIWSVADLLRGNFKQSHNTHRLDVDGMKELLMKLDFIKAIVSDGEYVLND